MANVKNNAASRDTQRRLLDAAGEVFAERGFASATLREITTRAGASIASINYHFRDKAELYAAVINNIEQEWTALVFRSDQFEGSAEDKLRQFIRQYVFNGLRRARPAWERLLVAREFSMPSLPFERLLENVIRPLHADMAALVAEVVGTSPSRPEVGLIVASIVGQCVYFLQHHERIASLHPQVPPGPFADRVADHITNFSMSAIRGACGRPVVRLAAKPRTATRAKNRRRGD